MTLGAAATMEAKMLEARIKAVATSGTVIPKPQAQAPFRVKGDGIRRGRRALVYTIPNHGNPAKPHEKGVTYVELEEDLRTATTGRNVDQRLASTASSWLYAEGSCDFTTVGGLFVLLGKAEYAGPGSYIKR
jgi:hypothetical protein